MHQKTNVVRRMVGNLKDECIEPNASEEKDELKRLTLAEKLMLIMIGKNHPLVMSTINEKTGYILRGCVLLELAIRDKIRTMHSSNFKVPIKRHLEVKDDLPTGDIVLDTALSFIQKEKHTIGGWLDILAGETWSRSNAKYQLKKLKEKSIKSMADKGIIKISKKTYLYIFDLFSFPISEEYTHLRVELIDGVKSAIKRFMDHDPLSPMSPSFPTSKEIEEDLLCVLLLVSGFLSHVLDGFMNFTELKIAVKLFESMTHVSYSHNDIIAGVLTKLYKLDTLGISII